MRVEDLESVTITASQEKLDRLPWYFKRPVLSMKVGDKFTKVMDQSYNVKSLFTMVEI